MGDTNQPMADCCKAGFEPYVRWASHWLSLCADEWIEEANVVACSRCISSGGGAPLRFVAHDVVLPLRSAADYETRIFTQGIVSCRTEGEGAIHDLFNALVWLSLPATKTALNRLHVEGLLVGIDDVNEVQGSRGRQRDRATLLDESGVLWISDSRACDDALRERRWLDLFVAGRERLSRSVRPVVVGHGLLQKLLRPCKALTAHCLLLDARGLVGGGSEPASIDLRSIDQLAAVALACADLHQAPRLLTPLPVMGLPGWHPDNVDPAFFYDTQVFRPPR